MTHPGWMIAGTGTGIGISPFHRGLTLGSIDRVSMDTVPSAARSTDRTTASIRPIIILLSGMTMPSILGSTTLGTMTLGSMVRYGRYISRATTLGTITHMQEADTYIWTVLF